MTRKGQSADDSMTMMWRGAGYSPMSSAWSSSRCSRPILTA